jgi:Bacterial protein of unknown function (DUF839)
MKTRLGLLFGLVLVTAAMAAFGGPAGATHNRGFNTAQEEMLALGPGAPPGSSVDALISVGETLSPAYRFEAIPDGISLRRRGGRKVDVFVNHETSTVPFPFTFPGAPTESNQNDFDNAQLSHLTLDRRSAGVLSGRMAINSAEGFQRFCSNYLATWKEGFSRPILFTNEEAIDWVNREGKSWPATEGAPEARQAGVVVAHDVRRDTHEPIWGMGRFNHENNVAIPGYRVRVLLSTDDSFVSNPPQSQLYAYIAKNTKSVLNDEGDLYAFVAEGASDYYDFPIADSSKSVTGRFVRVPDFADDPAKSIAHGRKANGEDVVAADFGFPAPPADDPASWQRSIFPPRHGVDGPQWVLETWGDRSGVFQFVRLEDIAYDKRPGMRNVIYIADTGRGATSPGGNEFTSSNGRIWRLVLDKKDPTKVQSLSVLVEGDDAPVKTLGEIHQPDNLETAKDGGLFVTEDPGSSQQFAPPDFGLPNATTARIWRLDLDAPQAPDVNPVVVAKVDQSLDENTDPGRGAVDEDAAGIGSLGAWESSGIVDASSAFGPGAFLVAVQAHSYWVEKLLGDDNFPPAGADFWYKREGGQLLLLRLGSTEDEGDEHDEDDETEGDEDD